MSNEKAAETLKESVRDFWNRDPCGTRYLGSADEFSSHARARYTLEPYIPEFAKFDESRGRKVLEIGVGMGADYLRWLQAGADASGIDLSASSIEQARRRCEFEGYQPILQVSDAEHLSFEDNSFDVVYSYGVMHHSPDTQQCLNEAWRVLKPGGEARIMVYHHPSLTGLMLWLRFGLFRGKSLRESVYLYLESPGTKSYTQAEAQSLMARFDNVVMRQVFSPGDLLLNKPSERFQGGIYRALWALYPRFLARWFCRSLGLFLLITARKPG